MKLLLKSAIFLIILIIISIPTRIIQAQETNEKRLIKSAESNAVYYLGDDDKRYVFPNEKTYRTWYEDFSDVLTVSAEELASYQIGGNITYRPGTRLIKITTDPKTYAVEPGGVLRWIISEEIAQGLYGNNWASLIDDVADTFFINYKSDGLPIDELEHPIGTLIKYPDFNDVYVTALENGKIVKRKIETKAFASNNYRNEFILTIPEAINYSDTASVTNKELNLFNPLATRISPIAESPVVSEPKPVLPELVENSIFVDNRVEESGDGTQENPFQTISEGLTNISAGQTIYVRGTADDTGLIYNEEISLSNSGSNGNPTTLTAYPEEKVIVTFAKEININKSWWDIKDLIFDHQGSSFDAFVISGQNINFNNVEIFNGSQEGVFFEKGAENIVIRNSRIHDFNTSGVALGHCIEILSTPKNITIENSSIYNCSGDAINLNAGSVTNPEAHTSNINIINNNLYTNHGALSQSAIEFQNANDVEIKNNNIYGFSATYAIIIKRDSRDLAIIGNKIYDSQGAFEILKVSTKVPQLTDFANNVIYNITGLQALHLDGVKSLRIIHNTFVDIAGPAIKVGALGIESGLIQNNLFSSTGSNIVSSSATQKAIVSNNGWFNGAQVGQFAGSGDIHASDVEFIDAANNNYELQINSPAVDTGASLNIVNTDFNNNPRTKGSAPDLGAFETQ